MTHFPKICYGVILTSPFWSSIWPLFKRFPHQNSVCTSILLIWTKSSAYRNFFVSLPWEQWASFTRGHACTHAHTCTLLILNVAAECLALWLCIYKVSGSNLGQKTSYTVSFHGFLQSLQAHASIMPHIRSQLLPSMYSNTRWCLFLVTLLYLYIYSDV
jgi:hypothetical protein